jgi:hypothetical protein
MMKHASVVRMVKALLLAAHLSKAGWMVAAQIARSSMPVLNAACPMVSSGNRKKPRKYCKLAHILCKSQPEVGEQHKLQ